MVARNDITGDAIQSKMSNENYRNNYESIFGKSKLELRLEKELNELKQETKENDEK